jgi:hypothetical protein
MQGQVSSSADVAPIEEGSDVERASADGSVAHHDQDLVAQPRGTRTRSKSEISKPKVYTDGTIHYSLFTSTGEPQTLDEAFGSKDWKIAMDTEYSALQGNNTWHLVAPKEGKNIIDCKWVFKVKKRPTDPLNGIKQDWLRKASNSAMV